MHEQILLDKYFPSCTYERITSAKQICKKKNNKTKKIPMKTLMEQYFGTVRRKEQGFPLRRSLDFTLEVTLFYGDTRTCLIFQFFYVVSVWCI